jgi:lipoyl(octanoyl) transferase
LERAIEWRKGTSMNRSSAIDDIEWERSEGLVPYPDALSHMNARIEAISAGRAREKIWLVEHPPLYTSGTSAASDELLDPRFPVFEAGRGGRYTYHGPGQRVGYIMLNLNARGRDVRQFVNAVEGWVIGALSQLGVESWRVDGRIGIWTLAHGREAKIGAIGVRVRRWVTMHGFSINVAPDLSHFGGIIPCGLAESPVTSMADLGILASLAMVDEALSSEFSQFLESVEAIKKYA